jgi:quinol monooxygenase YgiN
MVVIEFACKAKQGHFAEVQTLYSAFAADFLSTHEALQTVLVFADEAAGEVRGLGVYDTREAADAVSSDPQFAAFNDAVAPLLAETPNRHEYSLLHFYSEV